MRILLLLGLCTGCSLCLEPLHFIPVSEPKSLRQGQAFLTSTLDYHSPPHHSLPSFLDLLFFRALSTPEILNLFFSKKVRVSPTRTEQTLFCSVLENNAWHGVSVQ